MFDLHIYSIFLKKNIHVYMEKGNYTKQEYFSSSSLKEPPVEKEFDSPYVLLTLRNGIVIGTYKKDQHITLEIAHDIVRQRQEFTDHQTLPAMIIGEGIVSMDKDARDYLASPEGTAGIRAAALVLNSPFIWALGNFFVTIRKPSMPVRIFNSTEKAAKWLQKFVN